MSKEEKAKEYVSNIDFSNNTGIYIENEMKGTAYQGYIDGYTKAEQDLSSQLTACKEALREVVDTLQNRCDKYGMSPIEYEVLTKAKTLIE